MKTTDIKEFSQLAQAAYSWFDSGDYYYNDPAQGGAISKMMAAPNGAFPEKEASLFADRYVVLYQYRDDKSVNLGGFSATVFQDRANNNRLILSFRGTEFKWDKCRDLLTTDAAIERITGSGLTFQHP